ncbi:MAG: hypothetical protein INR71_03765 [Terriglobus roseus]|nr:hypothetical protein [Terriglobus roseus]
MQLSAQLKTRLSYAMVKVQNGWEKRSIDELENSIPASSAPAQLQASRTPSTPTPTARTPYRASRPSPPSTAGTARAYGAPFSARSQGFAHSPDAYGAQSPSAQPALLRRTTSSSSGGDGPTSKSPRTYASFWANHTSSAVPAPTVPRHAHHSSTSTVTSSAPSLAPAADVTSTSSKRRSHHGRAPPSLSLAVQRSPVTKGQVMSPRTPRQNLLRMPSQQAEKDAVDTLMFLSSPNNSSNMKYGSQGSPLRSAFSTDLAR